jgi:type II secretory pathway component GspD/PulD (secretin)
MRTVVQAIDIRNPSAPVTDVVDLRTIKPTMLIQRLRPLYPHARIEPASKASVLVRATPQELTEIKALISSLDVAPPTATPAATAQDVVTVHFAEPRVLARSLVHQLAGLHASVSGTSVLLSGTPDAVDKAKTLAQVLDVPAAGAKYSQVYPLHNIDAASVAKLVQSSYPQVKVTVNKDLNSISVLAMGRDHDRIAAAIAQLDAMEKPGQGAQNAGAAFSDANVDVVDLDSAIPGQGGNPSTSAQDIANAVQQALQGMAPDLHVSVPANTTEIILAGSPMSIRLAHDVITRLDRSQPLVVLDTEVLEVDENAARNVGLQFPGATIQSVFQEIQPTPDPLTGQQGRLIGLQPLTRTALQFTAEINFLISHGNARVLADPRVTTISGHTATIRAGDTINILTQTAGGVGTPVTQQLQAFNTGVTLDITPQVGPTGKVTVMLHPVVNSLTGLLNGVPQIATRDTQTVVQLANNQTLVIGGLIQETMQHQVSKLPLLGDLPLIGKLFQNSDVESQRNELVIVVTPHIINVGEPGAEQPSIALPTPQPLPTVPTGMQLPSPAAEPQPVAAPSAPPTPAETPTPTAEAPAPTPTAFASTNVFVYGSPPPITYAPDSAPPRILYAQFAPTLLSSGIPVQVYVVTTTNVRKVEVGYPGYMTALTEAGPSKWQGSYRFNASGLISSQQNFALSINAYTPTGGLASIQVPVGLLK